MKYSPYIFVALVIALFYFGVFDTNKSEQLLSNGEQVKQSVEEVRLKQWEAKIDEQLPVTVKVTPVELGEDAQLWKFQVVLDTHSGSLDEDLLKMACLADDENNVYYPIAWEGPGPGGHHREGILVFKAMSPVPLYIELKIKNVGGVSERSFRWNM